MNGKDLLAVLAMIVPTLILIAAIAFALGLAKAAKVEEGHDAPVRAKAQAPTQKRMRDPWEKPAYAKTANTSGAPRAPQCDPAKIERDGRCLYW